MWWMTWQAECTKANVYTMIKQSGTRYMLQANVYRYTMSKQSDTPYLHQHSRDSVLNNRAVHSHVIRHHW